MPRVAAEWFGRARDGERRTAGGTSRRCLTRARGQSHVYRMGKQAISVTLEADNLTWLRGRARAATRSVSETLDRLIVSARKGGAPGEARSVAGTISIAPGDPELVTADAALRSVFARSVGRAASARRRKAKVPGPQRPRG